MFTPSPLYTFTVEQHTDAGPEVHFLPRSSQAVKSISDKQQDFRYLATQNPRH
jgi:hypothetical protein